MFRISPGTGALSTKPVQTVATGSNPQMITIAPDGKNAYVTSGNGRALAQFAISPATGKITPPVTGHRHPPQRITRPGHHPDHGANRDRLQRVFPARQAT